jgi:hypothetical protein
MHHRATVTTVRESGPSSRQRGTLPAAMLSLRMLIHAALAACLIAPLACVAGAPDRPAGIPAPPAPLSEIRSDPPAPGMVWVPGSWHWNVDDYVWLPGRWESAPPVPMKP